MPSRIVVKSPEFKTLSQLNARVIECERCPRLRAYCAEIARVKRRAHIEFDYWARPVPSFGDPEARVWVLGLAPAAHGSNRTGRPFTGDGPRSMLYPVLHATGFASQPDSIDRNDGMKLADMWIGAVGRCAPPDNKPTPEEIRNCGPWLDAELQLLSKCSVVVCLGKIAFDAFLSSALRVGIIPAKRGYTFAHAAEYKLPNGLMLISSYHPSLQNTNTGRLTRAMLEKIFKRAQAGRHSTAQSKEVGVQIMTKAQSNETSLASNLWDSESLLLLAEPLIPRAQNEGGAASVRLAEFPRHYTELAFRCGSGIGEVHAHFADTFFILAGTATLITGGKLVEPKKIGPGEARGISITGEARQQLNAGAVVHIPAGLAHQMILSSDETITYFVVKIQESDIAEG